MQIAALFLFSGDKSIHNESRLKDGAPVQKEIRIINVAGGLCAFMEWRKFGVNLSQIHHG